MADLRTPEMRLPNGDLVRKNDLVMVTRERRVRRGTEDVDKTVRFTARFFWTQDGAARLWRDVKPSAGWRSASPEHITLIASGDNLATDDPSTPAGLANLYLVAFDPNTGTAELPDEIRLTDEQASLSQARPVVEAERALAAAAYKRIKADDETRRPAQAALKAAAAAYLSAYEDFYEEALS